MKGPRLSLVATNRSLSPS